MYFTVQILTTSPPGDTNEQIGARRASLGVHKGGRRPPSLAAVGPHVATPATRPEKRDSPPPPRVAAATAGTPVPSGRRGRGGGGGLPGTLLSK